MNEIPTSPRAAFVPIPVAAGIGLRFPHHQHVIEHGAGVSWLEVHAENYMDDAAALKDLEIVRANHTISLHAVGLSLGSADGVDLAHVRRLKALELRIEPGLVSDHLSWSTVGGVYIPDLLPLPYTREALDLVSTNVACVQEVLKRPLTVENPSIYLRFAVSEMTEQEFLAELARRTGCGVLLDINNIYVSACNLGADPAQSLRSYLRALDPASIEEMHLAGHAVKTLPEGVVRIDDHGSAVAAEVWSLYETALSVVGPRPTLIEWDTRIPAFEVLQTEAARAQRYLDLLARHDRTRTG